MAILLPLCQSLWLGKKFMISPLATSLLRSRTVCWGKGKDCSEAEHDYLQALVSLRTVQRPFQWGGSWQEVVIWGCVTVQLVLMSSIKTLTSYVSFIHIQHQCFKQNCRKEQLMFVPVCICIKVTVQLVLMATSLEKQNRLLRQRQGLFRGSSSSSYPF